MSENKDFNSELLEDLFEDVSVPDKPVENTLEEKVEENKAEQSEDIFDLFSEESDTGVDNKTSQENEARRVEQQIMKKRPVPSGSLGNTVKPRKAESNNTMKASNPYVEEKQEEKKPKEKKELSKWQKQLLLIVGIIIVIVIVSVSGFKVYDSVREKPLAETEYSKTGRKPVDEYIKMMNDFDVENLNKYAEGNFTNGVSYIGMEKEYANSDEIKEKFLQKVFGVVKVTYPQVALKSNKNRDYIDKSGNKVMVDSDLVDGESVKLTIPDWGKIASDIDASKDSISSSFQANGYNKADLDITDKMSVMFCSYINSLPELPVKEVDWTPELDGVKSLKLKSDDMLDNLILGSDEYHLCLDNFGKASIAWTPTVKQSYIGKNPKYKKWVKQYKKITSYYKKKGMTYPGGESLIKYNKKMELQKYKKGKNKGQYVYIKKPKKKAKLKRDVDNPYVSELCLPYTYLGSYYAQNCYNNGQTKVMPLLGNGTFKQPAGVGTPVLTKLKAKNGKFYDCRVTLKMCLAGQSAIDYAAKFSEKNRGFLSNNKVQLACLEVEIENLSKKTLKISEDLSLCDERNDMSPRTGLLYGLKMKGKVKAGKKITLQSYLVDTDLANKYLIWGRSFNRKYEPVWFRVFKNNQEETKQMLEENNSDISGNATEVKQ